MTPFTRRIDGELARFLISTCRALALVAGVFSVAMATLLVANYVQLSTLKPLDNPALTALREHYRSTPENDELAANIRVLDLAARRAYFTRQWQTRTAGYLLLAGVALLFACLRAVSSLAKRLPQAPPEGVEAAPVFPRAARAGLTVVGGIFLVGAVMSAVLGDGLIRREFPGGAGAQSSAGKPTAAAKPGTRTAGSSSLEVTGTEDYKRSWPQLRGPGGDGIASPQDPPVEWDGKSGKNVAWKADVPLPGRSSPVVWENRVFLTGADEAAREVFCWDAGTGRLLWRSRVPPTPATPASLARVSSGTGFAASTMAVNGSRAFAIFATGDLAALDMDGKLLWTRNVGTPTLNYGYASSLALLGDGVVVQFDQEEDGKLVAFNADGSVRWETPRRALGSWATPVLVDAGSRRAVVTHGTPMLAAYDPASGKELWHLFGMMGENAPSPAYSDGKLFVATQLLSLLAVDARSGKKLWEVYDDLPDVASPLASGGMLLMAASYGVVTCLNASDGEVLWSQEFPTGFYASPILAGGRFYALDRSGVMRIFAADRAVKLLGSPSLGEPTEATPAFRGGEIFIRGEHRLYCIRSAGRPRE